MLDELQTRVVLSINIASSKISNDNDSNDNNDDDNWAASCENVSSEIFDQVRLKPAGAVAEAS